jgi:hypothetical protein
LGAIVASSITPYLVKSMGLPWVLFIFAMVMGMGFLVTFWLPETKGRSLEEISADWD